MGDKLKRCVGKEGFQRMNYLYQLSNAMLTESPTTNLAASMYSNLMINISKKTVQRLDINMKRTICKGCRTLLLAGLTCTVRVKKKKLHWKCNTCHLTKIFDTGKNNIPWTLNPESIVEILDYGLKVPQKSEAMETVEEKTC